MTYAVDGKTHEATADYLVGGDGANSMVRRLLYPDHEIRKYVSLQQWFKDRHPSPFYSCVFDNETTDCYSWSICKDGYFIFGGAFSMKDGRENFSRLKQRLEPFDFRFGDAVKTEKCTVLCPSRWADFVCGKENAFLIGEAAGFISASSLEGISYALDSAETPGRGVARRNKKSSTRHTGENASITHEVAGKNSSKIRCLTTPWIRSLIMKSGIGHIPVQQQTPTQARA